MKSSTIRRRLRILANQVALEILKVKEQQQECEKRIWALQECRDMISCAEDELRNSDP
jgi:hypothetical protein